MANSTYPVDPNFRGALPGGPPLLTDEEARRLRDHRAEVETRLAQRFEVLRARLASLPPEPEPPEEETTDEQV